MYRKFVAPEKAVTVLEDVLLEARHGVMVFPDGNPVISQLDEVLCWLPTTYARSIAAGSTYDREFATRFAHVATIARDAHARRDHAIRLDENSNYLYMAHPFGFHAFGHLFDSLQRLLPINEVDRKSYIVIHSKAYRIVDFPAHLSMLGIDPANLLELENDVIVPRLTVTPWAAPPAQISDANFQLIYEAYTRDVPQGHSRRLYLSRNHVRPGSRMVLNEDEILPKLVENGFEILYGTEPLRDIVSAFNQAEYITGAHGSLFANTMFCKQNAKIVEYCPKNRPDRSFQYKKKFAKNYVHKLVDADENYNITIQISDVLAECGR